MYKITFLAFFFIFSSYAEAQDLAPASDPTAVQHAFVQLNKKTKSFSSDFVQTKIFSFMNKPLISRGKFYYEANDKLRWEYTEPLQYVMLINNDKVQIRENGEVKSYSSAANEIFKNVKEIILGCISGAILTDPDYESSFYENPNLYQVKLRPMDAGLKNYMEGINIFIDRHKMELDHLIIKDASGDETKIQFSNRKINQDIDDSKFTTL